MVAAIKSYQGVALKESTEGKSSQWVGLQAMHLVHFVLTTSCGRKSGLR